MKKTNLLLLLFLLPTIILCQDIKISGLITDKITGEVLVGANVYLSNSQYGTFSNDHGFYSINVKKLDTITVSYVGYNSLTMLVDSSSNDISINLELVKNTCLDAIIIEDQQAKIRNQVKSTISIGKLKAIPVIGGETDVLKSIAFLPGISVGQEGTSNLYVRGGTPDQNLILLDGIPIYNVNHLGGYLSVFNVNSINSIDIYKGYFPARFGGRTSSVIDISLKEGNKKDKVSKVGVGLVTSHFLLEGPFKKNDNSYIITARSSYLGIINLFRNKKNVEDYFDYWLYDLNAKTSFKLRKGKLVISSYLGNDIGVNFSNSPSSISGNRILASSEQDSKVRWGNMIISSKYVLPIRSNLFAKFTLGYSKYKYKFSNNSISKNFTTSDTIVEETFYGNTSTINDIIFQSNFDYSVNNNHLLKFGLGGTIHNFSNSSRFTSNVLNGKKRTNSKEFYVFIEDNFQVFRNVLLIAGLRYSGLVESQNIYQYIEPRISLNIQTKNVGFNASYSINTQYLHLLRDRGFGLSNDIWLPATKNTPPQNSNHFSIGSFFSFLKNYETSIEVFYRKMRNLIDYKAGYNELYIELENWENLIEREGFGESYGFESMVEKKYGKLSGILAYTLSWSKRKFENINSGQPYPFTYDRRHDISLTVAYNLNMKWRFSSNWIFQTGTALTLPVGALDLENGTSQVRIFDSKNNGRLPNYHRLDVGLEYHKKTKRGKDLTWRGSIYNAYNRKNPSYILLSRLNIIEGDQVILTEDKIKMVSLFSIIPAISLEYKL